MTGLRPALEVVSFNIDLSMGAETSGVESMGWCGEHVTAHVTAMCRVHDSDMTRGLYCVRGDFVAYA